MENHFDIVSIATYLGVFLLSLLFVKLAEGYLYRFDGTLYKKKRKSIGLLLIFFALLFPCLLAAFREFDVGRDVGTYIIDNFEYGQSSRVSFWQFRNHVKLQIPEILFALLMYICCKIGSIEFLFFSIELLILAPLSLALIKNRGKGSLVLEFALYYFLFYNFSLSGMRQSIAMSFLLVAITYALEHRVNITIILLVIAQLFHSSVLLIVTIVFICYLINKSKHKYIISWIFVLGLVAAFFAFSLYAGKIAEIVARVNPRYGYFIRYYFHRGIYFNEIPSTDILFKTALVGIPFLLMYKKRRIAFIDKLMLAFVFIGRYFVLFNGVFFEAMRIAYYFDLFLVMYVPRSLGFIHSKTNRFCYEGIYLFLAFIYWLYYIMYVGGYGTNLLTLRI